MRKRAAWLIVTALAACHSRTPPPSPPAATETARPEPATPQIPPVEFGRRKPNTRMSSTNMPYFDTVTYCEHATKGQDAKPRGPAYEVCVDDQRHTQSVMGEEIDANKYEEAVIIRCAKATRTAYEGMWLCMNRQDFR